MSSSSSQGIQCKAPSVTAQVQHPFALCQLAHCKPAVPLICIEACLLPCAGGHKKLDAVLSHLHARPTERNWCGGEHRNLHAVLKHLHTPFKSRMTVFPFAS